jgi:2-iminobutanoate/2-iminopropanoate deaminase
MSFADVAAARVYITDTSLFQDMNAAYRAVFPKDPPARATVKAGLMSPDTAVEITLLAVKGAREAVNPPNAGGTAAPPNPNLSPAIRTGSRLFLSGMLGNEPGNQGNVQAQTSAALARIARTLKAAGFGWQDIVDGTVYLTDLKNFPAMNQTYQKIFPADFPARATVETGLVSPDALVEIMFTASK